MTFLDHKEKTAEDCEAVAKLMQELATKIREGDMDAFRKFWWEGGTEEGDGKIMSLRETIVLRFIWREEEVAKSKPS